MDPGKLTLNPAWLRPLTWTVRIAAALIIVVAGYGWFVAAAPVVPSETAAGGLRAEVSMVLGGGRRLAFYLGPDDASASRPATRELPLRPPAAGAAAQASAPMAASASHPTQPAAALSPRDASSSVCTLGGAVISQASFNVGASGTVDAYGVGDVGTIRGGAADRGRQSTLALLQRVRAEGALAGLQVSAASPHAATARLPNILEMNGDEGEGDYAMGVAHGALDFLVVGRGDYVSELNPWYHSLNAGMRTQLMGPLQCRESASPAAPGAEGIRTTATSIRRSLAQGVNYVSDGHSRLLDFRVNNHRSSLEYGSEVRLAGAGTVAVAASIAADLPADGGRGSEAGGWNIERARRGTSRYVTMEIIVNGKVAASQPVLADGSPAKMTMDIPIRRSSWVAVRLPGAGHSNPVYVLVDNQPVRGSRSSVEWNLQALTRAHEAASQGRNGDEDALVNAAYDYAFAVYNHILQETSEP